MRYACASPHRVRIADRKRLSRSRLPVGQHRGVVTFEAAVHEGQGGAPVHLLLGGVRSEHVVELAAAAVSRDDHLLMCVWVPK